MGYDRVIQCIHYKAEGVCDLGKKGTFYKQCQHCKTYKKKSGSLPSRTDNRRQKLERIQRKERYEV